MGAPDNWRLKRTVQCDKCPWRVDVDPYDIPNGYTVARHRALERTIAKDGAGWEGPLSVMACHELENAHCIGWVSNQLGPGNNIALRIRMMFCTNAKAIRVRGEQHERFEQTLPKRRRRQ
jgi:hypothetical protein